MMGWFQDDVDQNWLHELAKNEITQHLEKEVLLKKKIESKTRDSLLAMRDYFLECARVFNSYSNQGTTFQEVKVYFLTQSKTEFMLFRNQVKLVFSNPTPGMIRLEFSNYVREVLVVDGIKGCHQDEPTQFPVPQELQIQYGPFEDFFWSFHGDKVDLQKVSEYYFREFIRRTQEIKKSALDQALLLQQIKTFLQEKGLNF